ncbi:MAG TPA: metal-dependent hydrolase [Candidatus Limnocylindrales bacterium]|nr:metal-dependent hydrolase [Candidatus Limnocylindrales bacterium]
MRRAGATAITWYGHACVEVVSPGGKTILFDPWFGNPRSPKPPGAVEACDLLLVTHGHSDHLGDALQIASRTRPAWPAIHELSLWLARNYAGKDSVIGMNKGGTVEAAGLRVTMTGADHSAGDWNAGGETTLYLGEPAGFVVELEDGTRLYHAGDTAAFGDMRLIAELHRPDLAMLPIGGHYTMDPVAAALAVELLGVREVLPIHYGTFPALAGTPEQLRAALAARGLGEITVHAPEPGSTIRV